MCVCVCVCVCNRVLRLCMRVGGVVMISKARNPLSVSGTADSSLNVHEYSIECLRIALYFEKAAPLASGLQDENC